MRYELIYIIHPDLEGNTEKITGKIKKAVSNLPAKIEKNESWGKKKLAYPIKKNTFGVYHFISFETEEKMESLEKTINLSEEIIRFMIVASEKEIKKVKTKPKESTEAKKAETKKTEKPKTEEKTEKPKKSTKKETAKRKKEIDERLNKIIGSDKKDSKGE